VVIYHAERNLAKRLEVRGDATEPITVRLQPTGTVTGRVLDAEGKPVAGADVVANLPPTVATAAIINYLRQQHPRVRTDADGRFRLAGVVPDTQIGLNVRAGESYLVGKPPLGMKEVKPGETLDIGEFRTEPRSQ
jgi:hypothetical protein